MTIPSSPKPKRNGKRRCEHSSRAQLKRGYIPANRYGRGVGFPVADPEFSARDRPRPVQIALGKEKSVSWGASLSYFQRAASCIARSKTSSGGGSPKVGICSANPSGTNLDWSSSFRRCQPSSFRKMMKFCASFLNAPRTIPVVVCSKVLHCHHFRHAISSSTIRFCRLLRTSLNCS